MKYTIEINYTTGNSFGSHQETEDIQYVWENLDVMFENMLAIEAHAKLMENYDHKSKKLENFKGDIPWWVVPDGKYVGGSINLKMDDGTLNQIYPFWYGYFEKLNSIEAKIFDEVAKLKIYM